MTDEAPIEIQAGQPYSSLDCLPQSLLVVVHYECGTNRRAGERNVCNCLR